MTDPRIAPVEGSLEAFARDLATKPGMWRRPDTDVVAFESDVPFPLFNVISGARFEPGTVERRARELATAYVERGLPFLWWATPSGHAEELRPVLTGLGMMVEEVPGMHRPLDGPVEVALPDGVTLREVAMIEAMDVTIEGFGMPTELREAFVSAFGRPDPATTVEVMAERDGRPVGAGTAWITGQVAGLYNIATLESERGRGIGAAITVGLMEAARQRGCTEVVLHASELGRPVYERLGFEEVCVVPQFVWVPGDATGEVEGAETVV